MPNVSIPMQPEMIDEIDQKAQELGVPRALLTRQVIKNWLTRPTNPFKVVINKEPVNVRTQIRA